MASFASPAVSTSINEVDSPFAPGAEPFIRYGAYGTKAVPKGKPCRNQAHAPPRYSLEPLLTASHDEAHNSRQADIPPTLDTEDKMKTCKQAIGVVLTNVTAIQAGLARPEKTPRAVARPHPPKENRDFRVARAAAAAFSEEKPEKEATLGTDMAKCSHLRRDCLKAEADKSRPRQILFVAEADKSRQSRSSSSRSTSSSRSSYESRSRERSRKKHEQPQDRRQRQRKTTPSPLRRARWRNTRYACGQKSSSRRSRSREVEACLAFKRGTCKRGEYCRYRHGDDSSRRLIARSPQTSRSFLRELQKSHDSDSE